MITAIKPHYDRKTKSYRVEIVRDADVLMVHHGYLVYDDVEKTLESVRNGRLIGSWKTEKVNAVIAFLVSETVR